MEIIKAKRCKQKLRIGMFGPSGSGKTTGALKVAYGLCGDASKILVIDTEQGSASLYDNIFSEREEDQFSTIQLSAPYNPERFIEAINTGLNAGFEVIIIDSISHEWEGQGGVLEIHERIGGNSYTAWASVTPRHNNFINRILSASCHIICCARTKDEVALVANDKGKVSPQKIGLKASTRAGFDYEMTLCFDVAINHIAKTSKDRTGLFMDKPDIALTQEVGKALNEWVNSGADDQKSINRVIKSIADELQAKDLPGAIVKELAVKFASGKPKEAWTLDEANSIYFEIVDYPSPPTIHHEDIEAEDYDSN